MKNQLTERGREEDMGNQIRRWLIGLNIRGVSDEYSKIWRCE